MPVQVAKPDFRGYTGSGCLFAALLCIPGAAFAILLFITLLATLGAFVAYLSVVMGFISAKTRKLVLIAIGFAMAVGGFLVFLGG